MQRTSGISPGVQELLRCPACRAGLEPSPQEYRCTGPACAVRFPVVDGIPVLINEQASVFSHDDFVSQRDTTFTTPSGSILKKILYGLTPSIDKNVKGAANYGRFATEVLGQSVAPRILVIGGGILGQGMEALVDNPAIELVETDVSFGPRTQMICDAHDLPFADEAFDGVIVQAVLEHVVDPHRCCREIHRVLQEGGVVYAETPFMQQVHGGRYDFSRFTHLGHRRLFRRFEAIDDGVVCGPGMALAWAWQYFLLSFATSRPWRALLRSFACWTSFHLKYFDSFLVDRPGALDAASGYYFLGRKAREALPDRELIRLYGGLQ